MAAKSIKLLAKVTEKNNNETIMKGGASFLKVDSCSRSCYRFSSYEISIEFEIGGSEKKRETGATSQINFPNINKQ